MSKTIETTEERLRRLETRKAAARGEGDPSDDGTGGRVVCYYEDRKYSPGARTCQEGKRLICQPDGTWAPPENPGDQEC